MPSSSYPYCVHSCCGCVVCVVEGWLVRRATSELGFKREILPYLVRLLIFAPRHDSSDGELHGLVEMAQFPFHQEREETAKMTWICYKCDRGNNLANCTCTCDDLIFLEDNSSNRLLISPQVTTNSFASAFFFYGPNCGGDRRAAAQRSEAPHRQQHAAQRYDALTQCHECKGKHAANEVEVLNASLLSSSAGRRAGGQTSVSGGSTRDGRNIGLPGKPSPQFAASGVRQSKQWLAITVDGGACGHDTRNKSTCSLQS